jgi:hypothetical protein
VAWFFQWFFENKKAIAMNAEQDIKKDLEQKILSKRQQVEFERTNLDLITEFSAENRENPDVMEEAKNYNDPPQSVVESDDLRSLSAAEKELNELLEQLEVLNKR